MLQQIDLAFDVMVYDPEEEYLFDHLEVRDAFLEFTSSIMSGYTKYLKDDERVRYMLQDDNRTLKVFIDKITKIKLDDL